MTTNVTLTLSRADIETDRAAVAASSFCSLWPAAETALQTLNGVVTNSAIKFAIKMLLAAGTAYCGSSAAAASGDEEATEVKGMLEGAGLYSIDDVAAQIVQREGGKLLPNTVIINGNFLCTLD